MIEQTNAAQPPASMTRAAFLRLAAGSAAALLLGGRVGDSSAAVSAPMQTRVIPATGEALPLIGLGTYQGFDAEPGSEQYARLSGVLQALFAAGGSVIDSSPMYGRAEASTGELLTAIDGRRRAFIATKVWTRGRADGQRQMEDSLRLLKTDRLDLMQVHNLVDWRTHLATLRDWKAAGRIRHIGLTHYSAGAYDDLAAVMRAERFDFLQINYSLDEREAERLILPLAAERGMAVLINRPFGGGGLLRRLRDRPLPAWSAEIGAKSWAQLLLKFVLGHPAVTCAIPGTSRAEHMTDNAGAGTGPIPDAAFWRRHPELFSV
jgi:aryl-alcohol dehydrogenase-like predicted oxidoreductase